MRKSRLTFTVPYHLGHLCQRQTVQVRQPAQVEAYVAGCIPSNLLRTIWMWLRSEYSSSA
jgi:hypothetical protein